MTQFAGTTGPDSPLGDGNHFAVSLMVQLVVPAFVLDVQGRVIIWNYACEQLTGIAADEVLGTSDHWRGFYRERRPTLADFIVHHRVEEAEPLYSAHRVLPRPGQRGGEWPGALSGSGWCDMPRTGERRFLVMDAGPIYDQDGSLRGVLETWRDMTVQKQAQLALERLVMCDGLTGIANRRCFDQTLHAEWELARRESRDLSLLLLDVDFFKRYNDSYGHPAGDECLKRVAAAISEQVRTYDLAARYGGEEFAVILPGQLLPGALAVAERIRATVEQSTPGNSGLPGAPVTVSIGAATVGAAFPESAEALLANADAALYRAKQGGRNRVGS